MSHKDIALPTVADDFDNEAVTNAVNPHTTPVNPGPGQQQPFGYFHGPIPNNNPGWIPPRIAEQLASGVRNPRIYVGMDNNPPVAAEVLSPFNTFVCDVIVDAETNTMCGSTSIHQRDLRRHMRERHPGAIVSGSRPSGQLSRDEKEAGLNALKQWVLSGGWRDAKYAKEPNVDERFFIKKLADAAEAIAANDEIFAAEFGTVFNRAGSRSPAAATPASSSATATATTSSAAVTATPAATTATTGPAAAASAATASTTTTAGAAPAPNWEHLLHSDGFWSGPRQVVIWCPECGYALVDARGHSPLYRRLPRPCPWRALTNEDEIANRWEAYMRRDFYELWRLNCQDL